MNSKYIFTIFIFIFFSVGFCEDYDSIILRRKILIIGNEKENIAVAEWFMEKRKYTNALKHLEKSLKKKKTVDAYRLSAEAYLNLYSFDKAEQMVNKALKLDPNSSILNDFLIKIKELASNRGKSLSEDLKRLEDEHETKLVELDSQMNHLELELETQKQQLETEYITKKKILESELNAQKSSLENELLAKTKKLESDVTSQINELEKKKKTIYTSIVVIVLGLIIIGIFLKTKHTVVVKKSKMLKNELLIFEGKKSDHQVQIDFERAKVIKLKKRISSKHTELKKLESSLNEKEIQIISLENELIKSQNEIKREWERIKSIGYTKGRDKREIDPYQILNIPHGTNNLNLFKQQRRKLGLMCHPDKVSNMHPEIRELAELLMKEVNQAYDSLKEKHN